jgi:hypothetical protein
MVSKSVHPKVKTYLPPPGGGREAFPGSAVKEGPITEMLK